MAQKIQSITGMSDILPADVCLWRTLEATARRQFENYGFSEIRTPLLEETALFARGIGTDTQVVQKEMYTFEDRGGDSVTLRPEGTAGVMRAYLQHSLDAADGITKLYYMGPMFRYERPQKGRFRQFHQIGVEIIGTDSPGADAEAVIMMDRLAKALGISDFRLEINSLGTLEERKPYLTNLIDYFKGVSGEMCADCIKRLDTNPLRILDCKQEACREKAKGAPTILDAIGYGSRQAFEAFKTSLHNANVAFVVNPRIVRGLDYYEKTTFEFVSDKLGAQSTFSGGGRYSGLAMELGAKKPVPAVGFSIGCERLILLMEEAKKKDGAGQNLSGVYFIGLNEGCFYECQKLVQRARDAGVKAEMDYTAKSMKSQMRRANKLGYKYAAIVGDDEVAQGVVQLKNLASGEQNKMGIGDVINRAKNLPDRL
ncbi:MAG: histidine--tRNA ligase [Deltaproteobacteria bacterium]|nr:histidine--tRNA ligase [Deltaproteobacteria bacterium]